ncbi:MAG: AtpZ/AtpI family protein [Rhodobiaceae bacterium]|nr:AtpZ/AtpI family protein [Rhodobiaceae bacterium]
MPDQTDERQGADEPQGDQRLDRLEAALNRTRAATRPAPERSSSATGYAQAMRLSSEFIAGIAVGTGLGWAIDQVFGIAPWGMIVFLMLGFAAGVLNVLRAAKLVEEPAGRLTRSEPGSRLDDGKPDEPGP